MPEQRKTHEEILNRLNRRVRTFYQCNSVLFQAKSEQELLQSICEILVAGGELDGAAGLGADHPLDLGALGGRVGGPAVGRGRFVGAALQLPRFLTRLIPDPGALPLGPRVWEDSWLTLPAGDSANHRYRNLFTGESVAAVRREGRVVLALGEVFANFPIALLASPNGAAE